MKNLKKAAERIKKAVKNKEKIIIYGDSDLDGIVSVIIAKEAINNLGGNIVKICFPDRENGHGINEKSLEKIADLAPALLIAYDFGISNLKEIEMASKMGFEVIIVDHHQVPEKLPKALIVNPKQEGEKYPFKELAAAGLSYYLALALFDKIPESLKNSFLELTALATISDMMPIEKDNEEIVSKGLELIHTTWRPGIQALLKIYDTEYGLNRINKINSLLNIRDKDKEFPPAYTLLTCADEKEAKKIAQDLFEKNVEKKEKIGEILLEVEERIEDQSLPIVFEGDKSWELPLLGVVASLISKRKNKPVFLYREGKECFGTVRAPSGFNVVDTMEKSADILKGYGGHAKAAGFTIKKEKINQFYNNLIKYFS